MVVGLAATAINALAVALVLAALSPSSSNLLRVPGAKRDTSSLMWSCRSSINSSFTSTSSGSVVAAS